MEGRDIEVKSNLEVLNTLSPYVRRAWDGNMPPKWHMEERVIFGYELIYIMEGKGQLVIEGSKYEALPGDLFFLPPKVHHSMSSSAECGVRQPHIHFDMVYDELSESIRVNFTPLHRIKSKEHKLFRNDADILDSLQFPYRARLKDRYTIEKIIFSIIKVQDKNELTCFLKSKGLMIQLISQIYEDIHEMEYDNIEETHVLFETVSKIKEYILYNYRTDITLDKLASMANVSKNHLIRSFKEVFNITPMQYLFSVRLEIAKQLIENSNNTISEICEYLGFSSIQYFSRMFKKRTQLSPTEYKKLYSKKKYFIETL